MLDLAGILEKILLTTDAHQITNIFLTLIISVFIISLILATFGKASIFTRNASGLLTSLGILGTFIGIVIGLLDFDPKRIDESIELLLSGLKTAFITSLAGMAGAISYKLLGSTPLFKDNRATTEIIDVEPRDILNAIQKQDENLSLINTHLSGLLKAIGGENDSSLVSQTKLLRADVNDNHKNQQKNFEVFSTELWTNLKEFSEMLSKSATEQVIQALKDVITDFNKNLTEQFGDNFKALDASVKKLVDWQDNYRIQLEEMDKQYSHSVQSIAIIEKSISHISKESKEIPITMASLKDIIETNQHQISELENHLNAFKEVKEQAVKAFPEIQKHIDKTIEDIALSSQKSSEGYNLLLKNTEGVQKTVVESIETIQNRLEKSVSELVEKQIFEMNKSFTSLESEVTKSVDLTGQAVNKQLEMMDETMSQEVNRVMTEMGTALARISKQFTDDYQELVNAMARITGRK
jgi:chromosome segregation ATPase